MSSGRPRRGTANEELFLESPSTSGPPVEALRILKKLGSQADKSQESLTSSSQNPIAQRRPTFPAGSSSSPRSGSPGLPYPDRSAAERVALQQQQQHGGLPYPDRERPPRKDSSSPYYDGSSTPPLSAVSSSSSQPGRHVSVVLSDAYPTPPAFRHREGRPARLAKNSNESQSQQPGPKDEPRPPSPEINMNPFPQFHQQYWPPPSRMTSTSTTAARRGSPPPPETPATATNEHPSIQFGGGAVEGRRGSPATGGPQGRNSPRNNSNAYISASHVPPVAHYQPQTAAQSSAPVEAPPRRPWTPTETPGSYPHGPPTVWHGTGGQTEAQPANGQEPSTQAHNAQAQQALESDFQRMNMSASPPPSYASLSQTAAAGMMAHHHAQGSSSRGPSNANPTTTQGYPDEKHTVVLGAAAPQDQLPYNNHTSHPAFHNEHAEELQQRSSQQPQSQSQSQSQSQPQNQPQNQPQPQSQPQQPQHAHIQEHHPTQQFTQHETQQHYTPPPGVGPSSPPPLPEGWMAHLDQASGQYYYIHIPTSRTQWEFPVQETIIPPPVSSPPQSTTGSYANIPPLGSPGFPPQHSSYSDSMLGMNSPPVLQHTNSFPMHTPPPHMPLFGIAMYKVAPVNGEYFGPYLRYTNMDIERGIWLGSIMLVTSHPQAPTVHLHQSHDLSPNPRQLKANPIYSHKNWTFYRYDIDIAMGDMGIKWTYAITSHLGCTRYEFLVAGRTERNWRFIAHSCNDFSLSVKSEEKSRLGGVGFMWKDVMQKHIETGGFHAQIGGGDQIYADRIWREIPSLKDWLEIKGKENRKNATWTPGHEDEVNHAYFHFYSSHFDQAHLREAWAEIPHLLQIDDHDIFDGFGSYPEYMQFSNMFRNIGRIAVHWYLLFQHHTTLDILHASPDDRDLFTITGTGWHFVKYLGPGIAVVGIDTRSERNPHQVLAGPTYQGLFPRIATLPPSVQHCILMVAVPIIYPRLQTAEHVVNTVATGKKAVTGTYNLLGKVVGSAAGVVGAKDVVGSGFQGVKKAFGKSGLMSSVVSVFGEVDLLDDLRDHWTHESKDLERTYFIRTLQGIAKQRGMRVTFLSGDVHCCGAGLVHDPNKPSDHKTMYQIITSAIVNVPPPNMVLKMLHNNKPLYVPQNGMRSTGMPSDTKEDMIEIFQTDVNGQVRELKKLMGRRNYTIFCAYDAQQQAQPVHYDTSVGPGGNGPLSLAVDFIVQGEGIYSQTAKYGPVVIPRVNY